MSEYVKFNIVPDSTITFNHDGSSSILILDEEGMIYKGESIKNGGQAYYSFLEMIDIMKKRIYSIPDIL